MLQVQRLGIVWGATIFFLILSPLLAIYALGYDFDIKKNDLKNTVTVSTETSPDNVLVESKGDFGVVNNHSNGDYRLATTKQFSIDLSKDGYLSEKFLIKGKNEDNSLVRLKKIHLLPINSQELGQIDPRWKNINFISKDYLLYSKADDQTNIDDWFIQQYSFNGFLGDSKKISINTTSDLDKNDTGTQLTQNQNLFEVKNLNPNGFWEEVERDIFWEKESQTFIFKNSSGEWSFWQSQFLGLGDLDSIWLNQDQVLLHDKVKSKNLYLYDVYNNNLSYLTDNIKAISFNAGILWLWHEDNLYKIGRNEIPNLGTILLEKQNGYSLKSIEGLGTTSLYDSNPDFKIKNVYQGVIAFINNQIFYHPDSQENKWTLIASDVQYWTSSWHSIFWIDNKNTLITHNLELGYRRIISQPDFDLEKVELLNLDYYPSWHRVFFYYKSKINPNDNLHISSVWYNPDFINNQIRTFSYVNWISQPVCRSFIESGYIFCIDKDGKFLSYRNLF